MSKLTFVFLLLLLSGSALFAVESDMLILGEWYSEITDEDVQMKIVSVFNADHTFTQKFKYLDTKKIETCSGKWKVINRDNILHTYKLKYSDPEITLTETFEKITFNGENNLILKDTEDGASESFKRVQRSALLTAGIVGGFALVLAGAFGIIYKAFRKSSMWGVICICISISQWVFVFYHWKQTKLFFFIQLIGFALVLTSAFYSSPTYCPYNTPIIQ